MVAQDQDLVAHEPREDAAHAVAALKAHGENSEVIDNIIRPASPRRESNDAAERQRRVRFKRKHSSRRKLILKATTQVQALNWTVTRIEEVVSALDESQQRDLLLGYCSSVREGWERVLTMPMKADRPDP